VGPVQTRTVGPFKSATARHVRFCLYPLAEELISAATLQRLREFLPQGWLS
jgi:hypothetical protein